MHKATTAYVDRVEQAGGVHFGDTYEFTSCTALADHVDAHKPMTIAGEELDDHYPVGSRRSAADEVPALSACASLNRRRSD